ncbi:MAG: sensor histidine kinase [Anaerolineae bacterium]|nr:sensor histidine kinase [Anaerolineae bacterium]
MTVFRELSQHILDIYENGAKAGASLVFINIVEDFEQDRLSIAIRDNGSGMDEAMLRRVTDPWVTTRTTRKVGLGIPFLKQTAEMCGGDFEIRSELGQGTVTVATFQHSHIDRPPLGDLMGTVVCMVVGYPNVDLVYRHTVGDREFTLDTRELHEILGPGVPLSDPEVLGFLHAMLEEGLRELKGEPLPAS